MSCREVHDLLPGLVLGELDREDEARAAAHLESCAGCRGARAELQHAVGTLRDEPGEKPSADRRARAVAAMGAAYEQHVLSRVRRLGPAWRAPLTFAAAALVAFSVGVVAAPRETPRDEMLTVAKVNGRAFVQRPGEAVWRELSPGMVLREGDRISGEIEGTLSAAASLSTGPGTEVSLVSADPLDLALEAGSFRCQTEVPLRVIGPNGSEIACSAGWFEASLRALPVLPSDGAVPLDRAVAIVTERTNYKKIDVDRRLRDEQLHIDLDTTLEGEALFKALESSLPSGVVMMPTGSGHVIGPVHQSRELGDMTLAVLVNKGSARIAGVEIAAGYGSSVNGRGHALAPTFAKHDADDLIYRGGVDVRLESGQVVRIDGMNGVFEHNQRRYWFRINGATASLDLGGAPSTASVPVSIDYGPLTSN